MRKKILFAVTVSKSLGLLQGMPERMAAMGWDVHVVSAPGDEMDHVGNHSNLTKHNISMVRDPSPIRDLVSLLQWIRLLIRVRPHILSLGTPKASFLGMIAGFVLQVPHRLYMVRGLRLESESGFRFWILKLLERITIFCSTRVLSVSKSISNKMLDLRLVKSRKVLLLGLGSSNGVDVAKFAAENFDPKILDELRSELGLEDSLPTIGYIGRVTRDKGVDTLVNASQLLSARGVEHQLLVVGAHEGARGEDLLQALQSLQAPVCITGKRLDVEWMYQLMTIFCLPTLREGFPNVVMEAHASGKIVVTTDATGAIDAVDYGKRGFVCKVGDSVDLAEKLEQALKQAGQHEKSDTLHWLEENYSRDKVQENYVRYYESLS